MDFGTIKNKFTQILIESHIKGDEKGKKLYKDFLKIIKEDETLRSHFIVYKNIENKTSKSEIEANEYLKENLTLLEKYRDVRGKKVKSITEGNHKLLNLLKKYGYKLDGKPSQLHECLHNLTTSVKDVSNINEIHESFETVKKWLTTPKDNSDLNKNSNKKPVDANKFLNIVVEKYNDKYSTISEEEKKIIKSILSENDSEKELLLKEMSEEVISIINKSLIDYRNNIEVKVKLLETKDVIRDLKYDKNSFKEDILKIYELKNNLN
jgi:hypothetical protein